MKQFILYFLIITCLSTSAYAQTKIFGTVQNTKGAKLNGVNISITDSYDGATTDENGFYSFLTDENGELTIVYTFLGYTTAEKAVTLGKDSIEININLIENSEELGAVVVTAGSFEAGDQKRAATVLSTLDVLTTGGGNADITASLKTLPGAQQLGDQEGLAVRGGSTDEAKQFIDGTMVSKPYYTGAPNIAQRGRFSPTLFKGTVFSTGGYSALYGQALSSALILESIDMPNRSQANLSVSDVFVSGGFQKISANRKSSWGIDGSYTNLTPYCELIKQNVDYYNKPISYSVEGNFRVKTRSGGIIKYYTSFSDSKSGIKLPNMDVEQADNNMDIDNTNWYNNFSWREYLNRSWKMNIGLSYSYNNDKLNQQMYDENGNPIVGLPSYFDSVYNFSAKTRQNMAQIKAVFEKKLTANNALRFGAEYWYENSSNNYNQYNISLDDNLLAMFAETDLHLSKKLAAKLGLRTEYSSILKRWNIAPRISLAYKTGAYSQISAAYGMFYQKPENNLLLSSTNLRYQQALHYILNYNYSAVGHTLRIEAFYKTYTDLVKTAPTYNNSGNGYARGIELYWRDKRTFKKFDYWISYSYVDTKRDYLNYPEKLQPNFAANHTATVVLKSFFPKIKTGFNLTYSFASGRPYYNLMKDASLSYYIADRGKTICYNDLGFSLNYLTQLFGAYTIIVASVTNVLGQKQVFGYNYSTNGTMKSPIVPTAKRFFFLGAFFSWGVDRRQDILDGRY